MYYDNIFIVIILLWYFIMTSLKNVFILIRTVDDPTSLLDKL